MIIENGIASNGNIGIGTNNPAGKLHLYGSMNRTNSLYIQSPQAGIMLDSTIGITGTKIHNIWSAGEGDTAGVGALAFFDQTASSYRMVIKSDGNVVIGGNLNVGSLTNPSDSRIKKDIEDINDDTALNKLLLIQPKIYNYIDEERNKGFGKVYGFIAQQIREVIPEAVPIINTITTIPNIYKSCWIKNKREVYHSIPLDTPIDTDIRMKETIYKIKEIYEDYFVIDNDIEADEVFVYGYNINDFHTLNKDYIFTLNVCATQELHRRIEAQSLLIKSHEDRIKDLEAKMERLLSGTT